MTLHLISTSKEGVEKAEIAGVATPSGRDVSLSQGECKFSLSKQGLQGRTEEDEVVRIDFGEERKGQRQGSLSLQPQS